MYTFVKFKKRKTTTSTTTTSTTTTTTTKRKEDKKGPCDDSARVQDLMTEPGESVDTVRTKSMSSDDKNKKKVADVSKDA